MTAITDPIGKQTLFAYNGIDELTSLTDPNGNVTRWSYDVEGRPTQKTYADSSAVTYTYENTTSQLHSVLDVLGQSKQYSYAKDDRLSAIAYLNAVNPTPNVGFAYDPYFPRLVSMSDGTGTTQYAYVPVGVYGALRLQTETGPLPSGTIIYEYDTLGRLVSRFVAGAQPETFSYDQIGRLAVHSDDLGIFNLSYLGQTGQITARQLTVSSLSTTWSYLPNSGDRRLASIANTGLSTGQLSTYSYTTTPENFIAAIAETSDTATAYPTTGMQTASYNTLNQLTNLSGQAFTYDANGNLLSDGQRTYTWDAENRLVGISYPGQAGKATAFAYDGLGRRTAITSTPAGGSAVTTSYIWCGSRLCQARNASNADTREYYDEGEFVPGSPAQLYYYGPDQLGSVRRVFTSTSAPAYAYDPYGVSLQTTAPVTDLGYAGMFYNADSGLNLTQYRAYNPAIGRWLSRDPIGEVSDTAANLYAYVSGNPISFTDPQGLDVTIILYAGAGDFGHIGIGVAPSGQTVAPGQTLGYYPVPGSSRWEQMFGAPGVLQKDTGRVPLPDVPNTIRIPTTAQQDAQITNYLNNLKSNPGTYAATGAQGTLNCATAVEGALRAAGIGAPQTIYPRSLMQGLQPPGGGAPETDTATLQLLQGVR